MKRILSILIMSIMSLSLGAFANQAEVSSTFNKYVQASNSYSNDVPNYYQNGAKIYRVVNKKQGGQHTVTIPFDRFIKELHKNSTLAKTVKYKNTYVNQKITKIDNNNYKLSATRSPRNDKYGLPCYFIFTKTNSGWKIKEESMTTNVQTFLNAK